VEISAKKLKYSGRKKFVRRGIGAELEQNFSGNSEKKSTGIIF
jgi:hypothetical protein